MKRAFAGCLIGFLVVALIASVGFNVLQSMALFGDSVVGMVEPKEKLHSYVEEEGQKDVREKLVQIDVDGIITSMGVSGPFGGSGASMVRTVKEALKQAVAEEDVKAIVLRINSPGGEVTASDTLYAAVKEAAAKKPVVVYMDSVTASGGYYIACGATKVVANETTLTASIGVIMNSLAYHELFDKVGLDSRAFTSGAFKDTLSGGRPMRDDEKAYVQNLVNEMYDRFLGIVSAARGVPKEVLKSTVADGRVVTGREALKHKLVDRLGYLEDAYKLARELGQAPGATVIKYRSTPSLFSVLGLAESIAKSRAESPKVEVDLDLGLGGSGLPKLQPGLLYYLPGSFVR